MKLRFRHLAHCTEIVTVLYLMTQPTAAFQCWNTHNTQLVWYSEKETLWVIMRSGD